jgi:hypothetical protein
MDRSDSQTVGLHLDRQILRGLVAVRARDEVDRKSKALA